MTNIFLLKEAIGGAIAARPAANNPYGGVENPAVAVYIAWDTGDVYESDGNAWSIIGQIGSPIYAGGDLTVAGDSAIAGNETVGGTLGVTGATTLAALSAAAISGAAIAASGLLTAGAGIKRSALAAKTADYPMVGTDDVILVGANSKTITLASAVTAGAGRMVTIKNKNFTGTTVASAAGTVDGAVNDTALLAAAYASATFISDGANWWSI